MAPARLAASPVPSAEWSSTTMTSSTRARTPATTAATVLASLNAGMTATTRLAEDIVMPHRTPGFDRAPRLGADDFADQRRPQSHRRPQINDRPAPDGLTLGDILGRVHAAALDDHGLLFRRHDALVAIAKRRLHGANAANHGGEFRHGHGKRMIGAIARAVVGDMFFDDAGAERHRAQRNRQPTERIVGAAFLADGVVGIADRHFEFIADRHHGLEIGVGDRRRIIGDALQQDELVVAGLAHDADRLPDLIACRRAGADDHWLAGPGHIGDEFEIIDLAGAELVGRHADPFEQIDRLGVVRRREEVDADLAAIIRYALEPGTRKFGGAVHLDHRLVPFGLERHLQILEAYVRD